MTDLIVVPETNVAEVAQQKKQTVEEALTATLATLQLQQVIETDGRKDWGRAYQSDLEKVGVFFDKLAADLTAITRCRFSHDFRKHATTTLQEFIDRRMQNGLHDAKSIADDLPHLLIDLRDLATRSLRAALSAFTGHSVDRSHREERRRLTPLAKIKTGIDSVKFNFHYMFELCTVTMLEPSYVCPDDFPKNIPAEAVRQREVLRSTNFDYNPKILEGIVLSTEFVKTTRSVEKVPRPIAFDPAMSIDIMGNRYVTSYWEEPLPTVTQKAAASVKRTFRRTGLRWTAISTYLIAIILFTTWAFVSDWGRAVAIGLVLGIPAIILTIGNLLVSDDSSGPAANYFRSPLRFLPHKSWKLL